MIAKHRIMSAVSKRMKVALNRLRTIAYTVLLMLFLNWAMSSIFDKQTQSPFDFATTILLFTIFGLDKNFLGMESEIRDLIFGRSKPSENNG